MTNPTIHRLRSCDSSIRLCLSIIFVRNPCACVEIGLINSVSVKSYEVRSHSGGDCRGVQWSVSVNLAVKTELDPAVSARISRFPVAMTIPTSLDSRRHRRVALRLAGRCMFDDRTEHDCHTINVSVGGAALSCSEQPKVGTIVVIYLAFLGRVQGKVVRSLFGAFAIEFEVSDYKRRKLDEQIRWLETKPAEQLVDGRREERIMPLKRDATLTHESAPYRVKIIDVSRSGAAIQTDLDLPVDSIVTLGEDVKARVVRTFVGGIGIEFYRLLPFTRFDDTITFDID